MASELELSGYTGGDSGLNEDLTSNSSLANQDQFQDDTGQFPENQPLGPGQLAGGNTGGTTRIYQVRTAGIFNFGDGSDGNVVITSNTTLTADKYYENLVVNASVTLNPGGYRIFVAETLTLYGTIARNGSNGSNGDTATAGGGGAGGGGGAALADGYLKGSVAGSAGGAGGTYNTTDGVTGTVGTATTNSLGSSGSAGGAGGVGDVRPSGSGGAGGVATASNVKLIANWHLATLLDIGTTGATVKFDNSAGAGGGGGGGRDDDTGGSHGGGGGGGGSGGGIIAVYVKNLRVMTGGIIQSQGGNGGNGGDGNTDGNPNAKAGGGGGGGGGNGGIIVLVYNSLTNSGALTVIGGTAGTGGTGKQGGTNGASGSNGSAGTIYQFEISM